MKASLPMLLQEAQHKMKTLFNNTSIFIGVELPEPTAGPALKAIMIGVFFFEYEDLLLEKAEEERLAGKTLKQIRFSLYTYFTRLLHGRLGRRNRKPLYICVEVKIKRMFMDGGPFTGFGDA